MEQREIIFRAWIPEKKLMMYQNDQYLESFLRRANLFFNNESGHPKYGTPPLMQFTGLYDHKGVKVFEGDIMHGDTDSELGFVVFEDGRFVVNLWWGPTNLLEYLGNNNTRVVVGNIYQNPNYVL